VKGLQAISVLGQQVLAAQPRPACLKILGGWAQAEQWCKGECLTPADGGNIALTGRDW